MLPESDGRVFTGGRSAFPSTGRRSLPREPAATPRTAGTTIRPVIRHTAILLAASMNDGPLRSEHRTEDSFADGFGYFMGAGIMGGLRCLSLARRSRTASEDGIVRAIDSLAIPKGACIVSIGTGRTVTGKRNHYIDILSEGGRASYHER